jgi:hypothetical protein
MARSNGTKERKVQLADIKYSAIDTGQFADEYVVTLVSSNGELTMLLHSSFLNRSKKTIKAIVIEKKADKYLIGLPNETFTTGSRAWFPKSSVLVSGYQLVGIK